MKIKRLLVGFVIPAQPVPSRLPCGPDWVHEINMTASGWSSTGTALVRLYSRNAYDWIERLAAIAAAAARINGRRGGCGGACPVEKPLEPQSSTRSTWSNWTARPA
jgi:hypothetical protein